MQARRGGQWILGVCSHLVCALSCAALLRRSHPKLEEEWRVLSLPCGPPACLGGWEGPAGLCAPVEQRPSVAWAAGSRSWAPTKCELALKEEQKPGWGELSWSGQVQPDTFPGDPYPVEVGAPAGRRWVVGGSAGNLPPVWGALGPSPQKAAGRPGVQALQLWVCLPAASGLRGDLAAVVLLVGTQEGAGLGDLG